jgi:hypothetical protein
MLLKLGKTSSYKSCEDMLALQPEIDLVLASTFE